LMLWLICLYCCYWRKLHEAKTGLRCGRVPMIDVLSRSALLVLAAMIGFVAAIMFLFQPSSLSLFSVFLRTTGFDAYAVESTIESNLLYIYHYRLVLAGATAMAYLRWSAVNAQTSRESALLLLIVTAHDGLSLLAHYLVVQSARAASVPLAELQQWSVKLDQTMAFCVVSVIASIAFALNSTTVVKDTRKTKNNDRASKLSD